MSTVREYGPAWIAAEFLAWLLFPLGLLWMLYDRACRWAGSTPQQRVARMVRWYPEDWQARHGDEFGALLTDAIAAGEDGPRMWLDVAREAAAVRLQAAVRARRTWVAGVLWTLGVITILPLTLVPIALGREGVAEPVLDDPWVAAVATIVSGLVLIALSVRLFLAADDHGTRGR
jgi:hypothetical protein